MHGSLLLVHETARSVYFYCNLYATGLFMFTACIPIYSTVCVRSFFFMIIPELMCFLFLVYMYVLHCHVNSGNHVFEFAMSSIVIVLDVRILSDLLMPKYIYLWVTTAYKPTIGHVCKRKFEFRVYGFLVWMSRQTKLSISSKLSV